MIFTSFYTHDYYQEGSIKLQESFDKFGLKSTIRCVPDQGLWKANCAYRAIYIQQLMKEYNDDVVWIDIDAEMISTPIEILNIPESVELAWYDRGGREILLGTSYWKNCDKVKDLLNKWYKSINLKHPEISQRTFAKTFFLWKKSINYNIKILPEEYCHIFDFPKRGEPVIIHNQWSRKYKKVVDNKRTLTQLSHTRLTNNEKVVLPDTGKKRIAFPVNANGWAFDVICRELKTRLSKYYDIYMFDPSKLRDYINQVDLVYFPTYEALTYTTSNLLENKPIITTISGLVVNTLEESYEIIKSNPNVKAVQVLNKTWYETYTSFQNSSVKFFMIPNGVNTKEFIPGPRPKDRFNVGWAGNDMDYRMPIKRINILRYACSKLGINLVERNYRKNQVPHNQMPDFYKDVDLYVNCSTTEGSNDCVLEAASCGVPVAGTPVGNMPELYEHGAIPIKLDLSDMEDVLLRFKSMPYEERWGYGDKLRAEIITNYNWEHKAEEFKKIIEYVLGG